MPAQNRQARYRAGLWAEIVAAIYFTLCGYRILSWRYRTPVGEIDLIAKRGRMVVFIEVKRRHTKDEALYAVHTIAQQRIRRAATWWCQRHAKIADMCDMRFDVVALSAYARLTHIKGAF